MNGAATTTDDDESDESDVFAKPVGPPVRKRPEKPKIVSVGWKHKYNDSDHYELQTGKMGGIQSLKLLKSTSYDYNTIVQNIQIAIFNDRNRSTLSTVGTKLLANCDGSIIDKFVDDNNLPTDFWGCQDFFKAKNHMLKVYLYTEPKAGITRTDCKVPSIVEQKTPPVSTVISSTAKAGIPKYIMQLEQKVAKSKNSKQLSCSQNKISDNKIKEAPTGAPTYNEIAEEVLLKPICPPHLSTKQPPELTESDDEEGDYDSNPLEKLKELQLSVPVIDINLVKDNGQQIGRGGFGVVKVGLWNSTQVAVKKIKIENNNKYVYREIKCLDIIRHPNIVMLMAVSADDFYFYIIMEHFVSVNLRDLIKKKSVKEDYNIDNDAKLIILKQLTRTIVFLHTSKPAIIHKDLKPANILVNKQFQIKICDMGLSRWEEMAKELSTTVNNNFHGTIEYMAPEILIDNEKGGSPSDIWSLACIIVEVFNESLWMTFQSIGRLEAIKSQIRKNGKPPYTKVPLLLHSSLDDCFNLNPTARPSATVLMDVLESIKVDDYIM